MEDRIETLVAPALPPVTLEEAKAHLRVDHPDDDALIMGLIGAATEACERHTRRSLMARTLRLTRDYWPLGPVELPRPPLLSVERVAVLARLPRVTLPPEPPPTVHVDFSSTGLALDNDGDVPVAAPPVLPDLPDPTEGWSILPMAGASPVGSPVAFYVTANRLVPYGTWPQPVRSYGGIVIDYRAGYGEVASSVPAPLRQGMLMLIAHWYETREAVVIGGTAQMANPVPFGVASLWNPYRLMRI